jgi:hypothetical protein
LLATVATDRAFSAAVAELDVRRTEVASCVAPSVSAKYRETSVTGPETGAKGREPMKEETASVQDECGGTVTVTRSSEDGFTDIHLAANGVSELFVLAFGDKGKHARTSIGMAELPLNVPFAVEVAAVPE